MIPFKIILCPTDFSVASERAVRGACELAAHEQAELLMVHVVPFPAPNDLGFATEAEAERFAQHNAENLMRELAIKYRGPTGEVRCQVRIGDAASEVVQLAKEVGANLIVMGTHGWTGWRHLVLGSVAEAVVRTAHCPVLTLNGGVGPEHPAARPALGTTG